MTPIAHRCPALPEHTRAYVVELPEGVRLLVMADFERADGPDTVSRIYSYCGGCGASASFLLAEHRTPAGALR